MIAVCLICTLEAPFYQTSLNQYYYLQLRCWDYVISIFWQTRPISNEKNWFFFDYIDILDMPWSQKFNIFSKIGKIHFSTYIPGFKTYGESRASKNLFCLSQNLFPVIRNDFPCIEITKMWILALWEGVQNVPSRVHFMIRYKWPWKCVKWCSVLIIKVQIYLWAS